MKCHRSLFGLSRQFIRAAHVSPTLASRARATTLVDLSRVPLYQNVLPPSPPEGDKHERIVVIVDVSSDAGQRYISGTVVVESVE